MSREPRIVAELGRPETPQETADRKAATSAKHRANQTTLNLVGALLASLVLVAVIVAMVVREAPERVPVDYAAVGAAAADDFPVTVVVPDLPERWSANRAELSRAEGVRAWRIGFLTPSGGYIGFTQLAEPDDAVLLRDLELPASSDAVDFGGVEWQVVDQRGDRDAGNRAYALTTVLGESAIGLNGTAPDAEFAELAAAIAAEAPAAETEGSE